MAGITRRVHLVTNFEWKKFKHLVPDLTLTADTQNGDEPEEPMALAFVDPDGETHIYLFTEVGRVNLIRKLTGGLVVPGGRP